MQTRGHTNALPNMLTMEEVARKLRVSTDTVRRWQHEEDSPLRGTRVGKKWLFSERAVAALLQPVEYR